MVQQNQTNEYDVILLGSGLGTLIAGTLLSRGKRSVLFLKERGYRSSFTREGYRFVPFSNFSERIVSLSPIRRLQALSPQSLMSSERDRKVTFQVALPEARVDFFCDRARWKGEWKREFPGETSQIEQFYGEMENSLGRLNRERDQGGSRPFFPLRRPSFLSRFFSSDSPLNLLPFSREFKTLLQLQLVGWGHFCPDRAAASLAAYVLSSNGSSEVSTVDVERLKEGLLAEYLGSGGKVEEIEAVEKGERSWNKGFSLTLTDGKMVGSKTLVLNSPLHRTVPLSGKVGERVDMWVRRVHPKYVIFPIFVAVKEKVIPVGMGDLLISLQDLSKPFEGGNLLLLAMNPNADQTGAPPGKRAITVGSLISWRKYNEGWGPAMLDEHKAGVIQHLRQLMPFFEDYLEFIDCDTGNEMIGHWSYPHFLYDSTYPFRWREGLVPTKISRDLFVAGAENFPYLGLDGEIVAGSMVAGHLLQKSSWQRVRNRLLPADLHQWRHKSS